MTPIDLEALKENLDIVQVASDLGCLPPKRGRIYQGGNCPRSVPRQPLLCHKVAGYLRFVPTGP